ncbi:hypothetical protein ACFX11_007471 [Malus domestica]
MGASLQACGRQKYVETGRKVHNLVSALTVFNCDFVLNTRIITMCNVRFSFGFPLSFRRVEEEELVPVECACNALIAMYGKCGSVEDAAKVFEIMPEKNCDLFEL